MLWSSWKKIIHLFLQEIKVQLSSLSSFLSHLYNVSIYNSKYIWNDMYVCENCSKNSRKKLQRARGLLCLVLLAPGAYSSGASKPGLYASGPHVVQSCSALCPMALLAHSCTSACTAASRRSGAEGFSRGCIVVARANSAPSESASQVQPQYCSASLRSVVFLH